MNYTTHLTTSPDLVPRETLAGHFGTRVADRNGMRIGSTMPGRTRHHRVPRDLSLLPGPADRSTVSLRNKQDAASRHTTPKRCHACRIGPKHSITFPLLDASYRQNCLRTMPGFAIPPHYLSRANASLFPLGKCTPTELRSATRTFRLPSPTTTHKRRSHHSNSRLRPDDCLFAQTPNFRSIRNVDLVSTGHPHSQNRLSHPAQLPSGIRYLERIDEIGRASPRTRAAVSMHQGFNKSIPPGRAGVPSN